MCPTAAYLFIIVACGGIGLKSGMGVRLRILRFVKEERMRLRITLAMVKYVNGDISSNGIDISIED